MFSGEFVILNRLNSVALNPCSMLQKTAVIILGALVSLIR
jgi:hypothetical protein